MSGISEYHIVGELEGDVVTHRLVTKSIYPRSGAKARALEVNLMGKPGDITPDRLRKINNAWKETPKKRGKRTSILDVFQADNRWEVRTLDDNGEIKYVLKIVQMILDGEVVEAISIFVP